MGDVFAPNERQVSNLNKAGVFVGVLSHYNFLIGILNNGCFANDYV